MIRVLQGDVRDVLPTLAADSVHCCVTSVPYFGLRDYGTAQWDGGDAMCDHARPSTKVGGATTLRMDGRDHVGLYDAEKAAVPGYPYRSICGKCGARRVDRQIGLEATPDEWLATLVAVFREVKRVLRSDGTLWCNVGDSYNANQGTGFNGNAGKPTASPRVASGLAPKQLLMMPARLALALQADGWWVRSDIIWAKPNPMPESVTDRPTSSYEHVFLLSKSARYFYDADAIAEPALRAGDLPGGGCGFVSHITGGHNKDGLIANGQRPVASTRSCRNVWQIATEAFPDAHFATYPTALVERCIRAGTSERGCCAACGKPWVRVTEETAEYAAVKADLKAKLGSDFHMKRAGLDAEKGAGTGGNPATLPPKSITTGWSASCQCNARAVPCTVLDPFAGAGTTGLVADRLGRNAIMVELNAQYCDMMRSRLVADCPLFAEIA